MLSQFNLRACAFGSPRPSQSAASDFSFTAIVSSYRRGVEIYGQAEPAEYVYEVVSGAVRTHKVLSDGRRQIGAFHLVNDVFGLENDNVHRFTAEAIVDTELRLVRRRSLESMAERDVLVANDLLTLTTRSLRHYEDHMLLLGRKTAFEKVAAFLLEMEDRMRSVGGIALPMSRRDIADYLGLTIETVSRTLSHLQEEDIIVFVNAQQRQIVIRDRRKLAKLEA